MEEPARLSSHLFANFFEHNPAAFAISRISDSKVVLVNEALLQLFEFSDKSEVVGKTATELNMIQNPDDRDKVVAMLQQGHRINNIEGTVRTRKGNLRWISTSILMIKDEESAYMVTVLLDITARKAAEDKVKSVNDELEQLVQKRTREVFETELEYHSVIEQATDAILISEKDGRYVDVNPSACALLGYTKEELLQLSFTDVLDAEELKKNPPKIAQLNQGERLTSIRHLKRKDGSMVPGEVNVRMLKTGRLLAMVRDISERLKEEAAIKKTNAQLEKMVKERTAELENIIRQLKESDDKFQKAFNASSSGMAIVRMSDARYVEVNDAYLNMIGFTRPEVLEHTSNELGLVIDTKRRDSLWNSIKTNASFRNIEMTLRKKSGDTVDILSSIEVITHNGDQFAISIIHDITAIKRIQQDLEAVNKELEAFSYSISHDLRAPLRSINGYAEIIREDFGQALGEEGIKLLNRVSNNAVIMGRLVDDLLEFSRLGKKEVAKTLINMLDMVNRNIGELKVAAKTQPEFLIGEFPEVMGDPALINQVWFNLISNAIKYSSKKEQPVVEIGSVADKNEVVFYVRDNGAGFDMDYVNKLFGVFQRLHKPSEYEGTGVGLAFVKRIITKHGGRVWAEGKTNEGATFFFTLPKT